MSLLLLVVSALHILILVLLFVATLDKSWWTLPDKESLNLWYDCTWNTTTQTWACSNVSENGWLKAVQALMVLSLILCCLSFILFMDSMDSGTMVNGCSGVLSFAEKRIARSILSGSSE